MSGWTPPIGDDTKYPLTAVLKFKVVARKKVLADLVPDEHGWVTLPGGRDVEVIIELSPDAWRGLARVFGRSAEEPDWRLQHQAMDGWSATPWLSCEPSDDFGLRGPGGFMHPESTSLSVRLRDFPAITLLLRTENDGP
jgi:hypothetical protein